MTAIKNIVTRSTYRDEIVGSGLRSYFLDCRSLSWGHNMLALDVRSKCLAYMAADQKLGNISINDPWESRPPSVSYWRSALPWLTYDLPWILFAAYAYCSNGSVPLKALMLLEQSVSSLTFHLQDVFRDGKTIAQWLQNLRQVYDAITIENKLVDGTIPYPKPKDTEADATEVDAGVKIEFK